MEHDEFEGSRKDKTYFENIHHQETKCSLEKTEVCMLQCLPERGETQLFPLVSAGFPLASGFIPAKTRDE